MFNFGVKGYNRGIKSNPNGNGDKVIFSDYIVVIANVIISLVLLTSIFIKCYDVLLEHINDFKNILYLEIVQLVIYLLTVVFSSLYCFKRTRNKIFISRHLFLVNILFNIVILFAFDLISTWGFKTNYNQIINNIINLIVIFIIAVDCLITHIKINKENSEH